MDFWGGGDSLIPNHHLGWPRIKVAIVWLASCETWPNVSRRQIGGKKNSKGVLSHPYVKMRFLTPSKLYKFPKFSVGVFLGKIHVSNRFSGDPLYMHIWMYLHAVDCWCDFAILLIVREVRHWGDMVYTSGTCFMKRFVYDRRLAAFLPSTFHQQ